MWLILRAPPLVYTCSLALTLCETHPAVKINFNEKYVAVPNLFDKDGHILLYNIKTFNELRIFKPTRMLMFGNRKSAIIPRFQ